MRVLLGFCALAIGAAAIPPSTLASDRAIYRCEVNGQLTFSDRPCAPAAQRYEIDPADVNTYEAPVVSRAPRPSRAKRQVTRSNSDSLTQLAKQKQTCERLARGLKDIRSKMRAGYKVGEGEKLKARQQKLKSQLRLARCG